MVPIKGAFPLFFNTFNVFYCFYSFHIIRICIVNKTHTQKVVHLIEFRLERGQHILLS